MVRTAKKILLVSAGDEFAAMAGHLVQEGFVVHRCADGARALEMALTLGPELMVVDTAVPLLPAAKLAQILRSNPRTAEMAFFFVGSEGEEVEGFRRHKDHFVPRPFNPEQLLALVLGYCKRRERTEQVSRQEQDVEGNLGQISLVDLLQVFGLNRKDGTLTLMQGEERGAIFLLEGCVINARTGRTQGMKAFYRLLRWEEGLFSFAPGRPQTEVLISSPMDHLLMEGLRQHDEMVAHYGSFPGPETRLALKVPREHLPRGLRPTTQEVLLLLDYHQTVADILDHCPRPDLEVLQILRVLLDKGLVEELAGRDGERDERPLLNPEEIIAIKERLGQRDTLLEEGSSKLVLLVTKAEEIRNFMQSLQGIAEFEPENDFLVGEGGMVLGDIGRLVVGETLTLRLFSLPASAEAAPLWTPFCRRLFGVLIPAGSAACSAAETFFAARGAVPVARLASAADTSGFFLPRGDRAALRALLQHLTLSGHPPTSAQETTLS